MFQALQGIDTIQLTGHYHTVIKMVKKMGLSLSSDFNNTPVGEVVKRITKESQQDQTIRYKRDQFPPTMEVVKLSSEKLLSNYMIIIRNTPLLFDLAKYHKTPKDKYCLIVFAGLHQPHKRLSSEAFKRMSQILKRKTLKLYTLDIAYDIQDPTPITNEGLEPFRECFNTLGNPRAEHYLNSYYLHFEGRRILYYDKYLKAMENKEKIPNQWQGWKRLEIRLTFDVFQFNRFNFIDYIKSYDFIEALEGVDEVARLANVGGFDRDYLLYQLNSLIDNRFFNNRESQKQFNSVEALERFKSLDFRRYMVPF